jgi:phosphate/sulfate permease
VNDSELLLVIVVATALAFDFTNGFHDTANAMATSIATRALRPKVAVSLCALLNFAGAFLSIKVAATISQGIVDEGVLDLRTLFAALVGAIAWNLVTWAAGLPSSSSHALIGGLIGAGLVAGGGDAIKGSAIIEKAVPTWVKVAAASAIALGTFIGGWRIIRTMGHRLTEIEAPQGFVAEASGASTILASSYFGYPLSTTHVVSGGILGVGIGKRLAGVRWGLAGRMVAAWLLTLPAAALVAGGVSEAADSISSGVAGYLVMAVIVAGAAITLFTATQRHGAVRAADV